MKKIAHYFSLVKFAHSIFALPFAAVGFTIAYTQKSSEINGFIILYVLLAMVSARNAAMAFNRYIDRSIDKKNPRTALREIPAGKIKPKHALLFIIVNSMLFMGAAFLINELCFFLSPIALFTILAYSSFKRFSFLAHFVLGLSLALAPIGAFLAIDPHFYSPIIFLALAVLFWVAGFDIIYAIQDIDFDRNNGLKSVPSVFGYRKAKIIALLSHVVSAISLLLFVWISLLPPEFFIPVLLFIVLVFYQHYRIRQKGDEVINGVFFSVNGIASLLFGIVFINMLLFG